MDASNRRFRGPSGAVFVAAPDVDERTILARVDSGEWTPVDDPTERPQKPKSQPAARPRKPQSG